MAGVSKPVTTTHLNTPIVHDCPQRKVTTGMGHLIFLRLINTVAMGLMFVDAASMAAMAASAWMWEGTDDPRAGKVSVAVAIVQLCALLGEIRWPLIKLHVSL